MSNNEYNPERSRRVELNKVSKVQPFHKVRVGFVWGFQSPGFHTGLLLFNPSTSSGLNINKHGQAWTRWTSADSRKFDAHSSFIINYSIL